MTLDSAQKTALPSQSTTDKLLDLNIKKSDGSTVKFKTIVASDTHERVLTVFIRHFFCGFCEDYVRALAKALPSDTLSSLKPSTKLVVIGCGDPSLIKDYAARTSSPYEIYADPSRATYDTLGFVATLATGGPKVPSYSPRSWGGTVWASLLNNLAAGSKMLSGGKNSQNGGELIWENGALKNIWRMAGTTDHLEIPELQKVLGVPTSSPPSS